MTGDPLDLEEVILDPSAHFASPDAVLTDSRLSLEDKRRILESWEQDSRRLEESESEAMGGGEPNRLGEVERALIRLEESEKAGTPGR